jgi:cytochrome c553
MIIQSRIEGQGLKSRSLRAAGVWSVAILCGSILAACSGTIETPTEEFPPREGGRSQAATGDDDNDAPPPRAPATTPAPSTSNPPVASNNDDDELPADPADDEEEPPAEEPPAEEPPAAGALSFENDIQPIFNATCGPCHAEQGLAGVSIGDPDIATAFESAVDFEDRVMARIDLGTMPPPCGGGAPGDPGCISEDDLADVEAWYAAGAPE